MGQRDAGTRRRRRRAAGRRGSVRALDRGDARSAGRGGAPTPARRCRLATSVACSGRTRVTTVPDSPARAVRPRPVQVVLGFGRRVEVHHQVDPVHVDAAGGHVGGDQDRHGAGGNCARIRVAAAGTCRRAGRRPGRRCAVELAGQPVGAVLGPHEQHGPAWRGPRSRPRPRPCRPPARAARGGPSRATAAAPRARPSAAPGRSGSGGPAGRRRRRGWPRTASAGRRAATWSSSQVTCGQEAHVGHLVGLVEHGDVDLRPAGSRPVDQVVQPARGWPRRSRRRARSAWICR